VSGFWHSVDVCIWRDTLLTPASVSGNGWIGDVQE